MTQRRFENRAATQSLLPAVGGVCLALSVASLLMTAPDCRAGEMVRRVQEELRKRHTFYGDIDGKSSAQLELALRRFQERKGLDGTGRIDARTLAALGVTPPPEDERNPEDWPEMPVLRSDSASELSDAQKEQLQESRSEPEPTQPALPAPVTQETESQPSPEHPSSNNPSGDAIPSPPPEKVTPMPPPEQLAPPPLVPPGPPAAPEKRPNLRSENEPPAPATPSHRPPEPIASLDVPRPQRAELADKLIRDYLTAAERNDYSEMDYYAPRVDYFNDGVVDRTYIEKDITHYYKRWPERKYTLLDLKVLPSPGAASETTVRFRIRFDLKGSNHSVSGETVNIFKIRADAQSPRLTYMREWRIHG